MKVDILKGIEVQGKINDVSEFRMRVFREYPYLYNGDLEYEKKYLNDFANNQQAMVVLISDGDVIVAVATSIPFKYCHLSADVHKPFIDKGFNVNDFYYYGEIMVDKNYRSKGIAQEIYQIREDEAKKLGFKKMCFATIVKRGFEKQPEDYFDPLQMWQNLGFKEYPEIYVTESWPRIQNDGTTKEQASKLDFWIKELSF